jgi:hypothetical protein
MRSMTRCDADAGSNPVSCSTLPKPLRELTRGGVGRSEPRAIAVPPGGVVASTGKRAQLRHFSDLR